MLLLSRFGFVAVVALVVVAVPLQAVPQGAKKPPTLEQDKQALLGFWKMVGKAGDATQIKVRFTDHDVRLFILSQSSTSFDIGGPHFEFHLVEKKGQRFLALSGANRDETWKTVKYILDGDKLQLVGAGLTLNNRQYDLTGEWTRVKKKM